MLENLTFYLSFPFVQYAFIVGLLISLCAALLGVPLVLKRFSFIGDGLSHVAFGAMAIAAVLRLSNEMLLVMPLTILCAVLLLRTGQSARVKGDAAVAMLAVGALAVGYLLLNVFGTSSANLAGDVCTSLFGATNFLTLTAKDVIVCAVCSALVLGAFAFFYHKLFCVSFDESFAKATGTNTDLYNLLIAVVIAVIIVLAMQLVGSLLISALVVFPALSAMRVFKSFRAVTVCAAVVSVACAAIGLISATLLGTPVGATIVVTDILAFGLFWLIGLLTRKNA